jgi:predicted RNase H-like HicB family nuclease
MATRNWTIREQVEALMRLPWTLHVERDEDGSFVARVAEIPDAIGSASGTKKLAVDLWESLAASLEIRLEHGDPIPLPKGSILPWESVDHSGVRAVKVKIGQRLAQDQLTAQFSATAA